MLQQLLECPLALSLLLHECFKVQLLLLIAQVKECLVLGLVEDGLNNLAELGGFNGGVGVSLKSWVSAPL